MYNHTVWLSTTVWKDVTVFDFIVSHIIPISNADSDNTIIKHGRLQTCWKWIWNKYGYYM